MTQTRLDYWELDDTQELWHSDIAFIGDDPEILNIIS